jgi:hypothetical protein
MKNYWTTVYSTEYDDQFGFEASLRLKTAPDPSDPSLCRKYRGGEESQFAGKTNFQGTAS